MRLGCQGVFEGKVICFRHFRRQSGYRETESTGEEMKNMFPADFMWGVSSASYQIEGAVKEGGRGESIWDRFSHIPGNIYEDENGDTASDFYHRWREDIQCMKDLGIPAFRLSLAWPRIFPEDEYRINEKGLQFYEQVLLELKKQGIAAAVTLYHWDLPQWAQDRGGWANREIIRWYSLYCLAVMQRFDGLVEKWITFNEPWVACFEGYYTGNFAPGIRDFSTALLAAHNMLCAHGEAVNQFRNRGIKGEIGITLNLSPKQPQSDREADRSAAVRRDGYANRWFLDPVFRKCYPQDMWEWYEQQGVILPQVAEGDMERIAAPVDFLGVNYYNIDSTAACENEWPLFFRQGRHTFPNTIYNWPITEWGLTQLLCRLQEEYNVKAIFVTENGLSSIDNVQQDGTVRDPARIDYLKRHIGACAEAIRLGVRLKGYFIWSFLDSFEWNTGYLHPFGLVHVDRLTGKRTVKESGYWLRDFLAS